MRAAPGGLAWFKADLDCNQVSRQLAASTPTKPSTSPSSMVPLEKAGAQVRGSQSNSISGPVVLDLEKNDGSAARPHFMSGSPRRILNKKPPKLRKKKR
ncbi:hypothetical protein GJAV_G00120550 [Gymnothorax javanicus]|nr:hypothetical protein GJAV_G00120550 [Gymnothorax javanicus]